MSVGFKWISRWPFNLFGIAKEHERQIRKDPGAQDLTRLFLGRKDPEKLLSSGRAFAIGRVFGIGLMLFGLALAVFGIINIVRGRSGN
jgi:hypothetical protein